MYSDVFAALFNPKSKIETDEMQHDGQGRTGVITRSREGANRELSPLSVQNKSALSVPSVVRSSQKSQRKNNISSYLCVPCHAIHQTRSFPRRFYHG